MNIKKALNLFENNLITFYIMSLFIMPVYFYYVTGKLPFMENFDGNSYNALLKIYFNWAKPFEVNILNPFQGLFSQISPMNIWLNPGWLFYYIFNGFIGKFLSFIFFQFSYLLTVFYFAKNHKLSTWYSIVLSIILSFLVFPPFLNSIYAQFDINPSVAFFVSIIIWQFIIFKKAINEVDKIWLIIYSIIFFVLFYYLLLIEPLWLTVLTISVLPFYLFLMRISKIRNILIIFLIFTFLVFITKAGEYILNLPVNLARVFFSSETQSEIQTFNFADMAWDGSKNLHFYFLLLFFWIFGIIWGKSEEKKLLYSCVFHTCIIQLISIIFIYGSVNWSPFPLPIYLEIVGWPFYFLGFTIGIKYIRKSIIFFRKFNTYPLVKAMLTSLIKNYKLFTILLIFLTIDMGASTQLSKIIILIILIMLMFSYFKKNKAFNTYPQIYLYFFIFIVLISEPLFIFHKNKIMENKNQTNNLIEFLKNKIELNAGDEFRGSLVELIGINQSNPYSHDRWQFHTQEMMKNNNLNLNHSIFWLNNIPTYEQYSQTLTPQFYFFNSRVLSKKNDEHSRNYIHPSLFRKKIYELVGIKYIISDQINNSTLEELESKNIKIINAFDSGIILKSINLIELSDTNIGNYSPTEFLKILDANKTADYMKMPSFDPKHEFILNSDINLSSNLVNVISSKLIPNIDGIDVQAESSGKSVLILPIQYSNCFSIQNKSNNNDNISIFRANIFLIGIYFDKKIDITLKYNYGFYSSNCKRSDLEEIKNFGILPDHDLFNEKNKKLHPHSIF